MIRASAFGKTQEHNLTLLAQSQPVPRARLPYACWECPARGSSARSAMEPRADARAPGSIAVGLAALAQGVQFLRVHDVAETVQALRLWQAVR